MAGFHVGLNTTFISIAEWILGSVGQNRDLLDRWLPALPDALLRSVGTKRQPDPALFCEARLPRAQGKASGYQTTGSVTTPCWPVNNVQRI
jgi:hypothetical protein